MRIVIAAAAAVTVLTACGSGSSAQPGAAEAGTPAVAQTSSEPTARPTCPNPEGQFCLGRLDAGTYSTVQFQPSLTYTVPAGWGNYEDMAGNFLLVPPDGRVK